MSTEVTDRLQLIIEKLQELVGLQTTANGVAINASNYLITSLIGDASSRLEAADAQGMVKAKPADNITAVLSGVAGDKTGFAGTVDGDIKSVSKWQKDLFEKQEEIKVDVGHCKDKLEELHFEPLRPGSLKVFVVDPLP